MMVTYLKGKSVTQSLNRATVLEFTAISPIRIRAKKLKTGQSIFLAFIDRIIL